MVKRYTHQELKQLSKEYFEKEGYLKVFATEDGNLFNTLDSAITHCNSNAYKASYNKRPIPISRNEVIKPI